MQLHITKFGNPVLRTVTRRLDATTVLSAEIQELITEMQHWLRARPKFGVGLAATQVGHDVAISVIDIKPTPYRPEAETLSMVIINPEIIATYGRRSSMWEGCISFGGDFDDFPYAKALRYKKIRLRYMDEKGESHEDDYEGLLAHVMQHETDHLNGVLFVDHVRDSKTWRMKSEHLKQLKAQNHTRRS
jgi:peptide deformylase